MHHREVENSCAYKMLCLHQPAAGVRRWPLSILSLSYSGKRRLARQQ